MSTSYGWPLSVPLITEKSTAQKEDFHQYAFVVAKDASKGQIARAVEAVFKVPVVRVRTLAVRGKMRRLGRNQGRLEDWKKAIVTIAADKKIDFEKT
ncbi:MAG: 50S ribosomal protein L23 [Elusimicrobia bacterium]|nr:50S ribosomal protein L23 [Elusimicrobiota bacterium]